MSALLGADTRRVDLLAERLRGHSQDIQDLRTMAQRAVAEMGDAWAGPDFESVAQRWEQEAGPRLTEASVALSTMAIALRAQAEGQRQASDNTAGSQFPVGSGGPLGWVVPGADGALSPGGGYRKRIQDLYPDDLDGDGPTLVDRVKDNVKLNLAQGDVHVDASLASREGGSDSFQHELSAGKGEAAAEYSAGLDAHGNLVASAGASAAAHVFQVSLKAYGGNDFANGTVVGKAQTGAEAEAEASGSVGPDGVKGNLAAEVFAGGKVEGNVGGTFGDIKAEGGAELSYGFGAHVDVDAQLSATKVGVHLDVGAALGVGTGLKFGLSVNPQEMIGTLGDVAEDIGDVAEDVGRGLAVARDQVASLFGW